MQENAFPVIRNASKRSSLSKNAFRRPFPRSFYAMGLIIRSEICCKQDLAQDTKPTQTLVDYLQDNDGVFYQDLGYRFVRSYVVIVDMLKVMPRPSLTDVSH